MKRLAVITVLIYALALVVLTVPVMAVGFSPSIGSAARIYCTWWYWLGLVILAANLSLLLLLPFKMAERRFIPRRTLKVPCIATAFLLANLFFTGIIDILCAVFREHSTDFLGYLVAFDPGPENSPDWRWVAAAIITLLFFWLVWIIVFRHFADSDDPDSLLKRTVRWLRAASIVELVVAIPSYVLVRSYDSWAPAATFSGIATGIAILLLCFGPRVYRQLSERRKR